DRTDEEFSVRVARRRRRRGPRRALGQTGDRRRIHSQLSRRAEGGSMKTKTLIAASLAIVLVNTSADAQWNVARFDSTKGSVYATFGLDPAFITTVGAAGVIHGRVNVQVGAEVGAVTARFDLNDWRARLTGRTTVVHWGAFRITGEDALIARGTSNA